MILSTLQGVLNTLTNYGQRPSTVGAQYNNNFFLYTLLLSQTKRVYESSYFTYGEKFKFPLLSHNLFYMESF